MAITAAATKFVCDFNCKTGASLRVDAHGDPSRPSLPLFWAASATYNLEIRVCRCRLFAWVAV